jgi:hypothetical protein
VKPRAPRIEKLDPAVRPTLKTIVNEGMTAPPPPVAEAPTSVLRSAPQAPAAVEAVAAPSPRPAIAPPPPIPVASRPGARESSQASLPARTFTTTAQDWPIAKVPSAPGLLEPGFGSPPRAAADGAEAASERSLPAFLPPADMLLHPAAQLEAANDGARVEHLSRADDEVAPPVVHDMAIDQALPGFQADDVVLPFHTPLAARLAQLPRWAFFAAGLAAGVVATWIAT